MNTDHEFQNFVASTGLQHRVTDQYERLQSSFQLNSLEIRNREFPRLGPPAQLIQTNSNPLSSSLSQRSTYSSQPNLINQINSNYSQNGFNNFSVIYPKFPF